MEHGGPPTHGDGFGPDTYGRGFADVYDRWYPADDAALAAVAAVSDLAGPGGSVLELGVGTGRLAVPLAARGHAVTGIDSSSDMLRRLEANGAHLPAGSLQALEMDLGDVDAWPRGPFEVVLAAFNLVCNLVDPATQASLFRAAAAVLAPGGSLLVETFLAAPIQRRERHLEVRHVGVDEVVLIASDTDPAAGIVTGQHIELRDGAPVRLRPWRLRITTPEELDAWAVGAGLSPEPAWQDWSGTPFDPAVAVARVARYRLSPG